MRIYNDILEARTRGEKLLAVLIDPDKFDLTTAEAFITKVNASIANYIFVGGSIVGVNATEQLVEQIKTLTNLPIILFPGDVTQITNSANAILFLSLLSGRNAEYLIGQHVAAAPKLKTTNLEIIPTGYVLVESGAATAVQKVTKTKPLPRNNAEAIVNTALAGALLGLKIIYLEAGSGAKVAISKDIISAVKAALEIPLIVGGGICTKAALENAYAGGADLVVIGTAFEKDESFFDVLKP